MALITYEDKDNSLPTSNPRRLFRDIDANEIKDAINTNYAEETAARITREFDRAFSAELLFDKNYIEGTLYVQDDDITFTVAATGNLVNQESFYARRIQTDGVHPIFFTGLSHLSNITSGEVLDAGTYQFIFWYTNGIARGSVMLPSEEVVTLTPLSDPANFDAIAISDTEIDLSWDAVTNATNIEHQYSVSGGSGPWIAITPLLAGSATTFSHTGLTAGSPYHYRIRAVGDLVTFANSNWVVAAATTENPGDVTAPVATFSPADTATGIPVNRTITIDFDEAIRDADGVTVIINSNVADYLTVKEDNISGANIAFTATINSEKTQILITPTTQWGELQDVFVQVDGIEDVNGNEASAQDATFTTSDYTEFNGVSNRVIFGDILDSLWTAADTNFWLEITIQNNSLTGFNVAISKYATDSNNRSFYFLCNGNSVDFFWDANVIGTAFRGIRWTGVLGSGEQTLVLKYDGSIDTNDGLDRVTLEINSVVQGSKAIFIQSGALSNIANATAQLAVGVHTNSGGAPIGTGFFEGEAKDFIVRSNGGATVEINVPNLKTGVDTSGNGRNGTFI